MIEGSGHGNVGYYFFVLGKIHCGAFLVIFRGGLNFFDTEIALRCAQDNLWVKKVVLKGLPFSWIPVDVGKK